MGAIVFVILTILTNTISGCVYSDNPETWKFYFVGQALSYVFAFLAMRYILKEVKNFRLKYCGIVVEVGLWLSISSLLDEMFFDPTKLGWNEVVFALIITIRAYKQWKNLRAN